MTTITYRDGVMAGDSAGWTTTDTILPGERRKVWRLDNGVLFGAAGQFGHILRLRRWIAEGAEGLPPDHKDNKVNGFWITPDRRHFVLQEGEVDEVLGAPFYAIGSGAEGAYGAFHMGASAERAVEVASMIDAWTRPPFEVVRLDDAQAEFDRILRDRPRSWEPPRYGTARLARSVEEEFHYPRANQPWDAAQDRALVALARRNEAMADLCGHFGRSPGALTSRLRKLGYNDLADRLGEGPNVRLAREVAGSEAGRALRESMRRD